MGPNPIEACYFYFCSTTMYSQLSPPRLAAGFSFCSTLSFRKWNNLCLHRLF